MNSIDIILVLDASGSMAGLVKDTVGGVNRFLDEQRKEPGDAYITLATFDTTFNERFSATNLRDLQPITEADYYGGHGGGTALLDAVGKQITRYANLPIRAEKTMFVITTDGEENSSREFDLARVRELIEQYQAEGWAFVFLGANASAWQGAHMGTQTSGAFAATSDGTSAMFANLSANTSAIRSAAAPASITASKLSYDTVEPEDEQK